MKSEDNIFQILVEINIGERLVNWYEGKEKAEEELKELREMFPRDVYRIEEGTDYIYKRCKGCGTIHDVEMRFDHYGIETGNWCDDCFDDPSKYTYRKDAYYDYFNAGEHLYPEDDC